MMATAIFKWSADEIIRTLWIFSSSQFLSFNHKIDCCDYNFPLATQIIIHINRLRIACETISWNANVQGPWPGSVVFLYKYIYLSAWPPSFSTGDIIIIRGEFTHSSRPRLLESFAAITETQQQLYTDVRLFSIIVRLLRLDSAGRGSAIRLPPSLNVYMQ